MNRRTGLLAVGGLAVALVAGGGTALAASASSGPVNGGVITGCYTNAAVNGSHVILLQNLPASGPVCPSGTTEVQWNQQGPQGPQGATGATGAQGPQGPAGPAGSSIVTSVGQGFPPSPCATSDVGDIDINLTTGEVYTCTASGWSDTGSTIEGPQGPAGPAGTNGSNGNTILNGSGAPASSLGNDGDFYLDTSADVLYGPKAANGWPTPGVSLVGNQGATGPQGLQGPAGPSTAGPSGLNVVQESGSGTNYAGAFCPATAPYVLGGGALDFEGGALSESLPVEYVPGQISTGFWIAESVNPNDTVYAYVICSQ